MAFTDITTRHHTAKSTSRASFSLRTVLDVWKSRRALARLDRRGLEDIGIDPARARHESTKPIWDVPATWRV